MHAGFRIPVANSKSVLVGIDCLVWALRLRKQLFKFVVVVIVVLLVLAKVAVEIPEATGGKIARPSVRSLPKGTDEDPDCY